jgi:hypothetical protein
MKVVGDNKKEMEIQTGISPSMTDEIIKYLQQVIEERQKKT